MNVYLFNHSKQNFDSFLTEQRSMCRPNFTTDLNQQQLNIASTLCQIQPSRSWTRRKRHLQNAHSNLCAIHSWMQSLFDSYSNSHRCVHPSLRTNARKMTWLSKWPHEYILLYLINELLWVNLWINSCCHCCLYIEFKWNWQDLKGTSLDPIKSVSWWNRFKLMESRIEFNSMEMSTLTYSNPR